MTIRDVNEALADTPAREAGSSEPPKLEDEVLRWREGRRAVYAVDGSGRLWKWVTGPPGCSKATAESTSWGLCAGAEYAIVPRLVAALAAERERRAAVERERDEAEGLMLRACALAANLATVVGEFDRDELQLLALEADSVQRATGAYLAAYPATASAPTTATAGEPLKCSAANGVLTITVGAGVLDSICGEYVGDQLGEWKITDPAVFAEDLAETLRREAENGTTAVHLMLDKAIVEAIENGAEGVEFAGEGASDGEVSR